ncbi:MAG: replication-relaxation family protein [Acidimicrobiales bacterium]
MAKSNGAQLTARDIEILSWVGRHGMVTADQVARHLFARDDGTVGTWAAYRRLRVLEERRFVRRDVTFARWPAVIRVTGPGARVAEIDVDPARLVWAEVRHSLALVDLTEELLAQNPGARLVTEREIRALRFRELAEKTRRTGFGRIPDGILHLKDGRTVAVEIDLTAKRQRDVERILLGYKQERYDKVWWFARPGLVPRLSDIMKKNRVDDLVDIRPWDHPLAGPTGHGRPAPGADGVA